MTTPLLKLGDTIVVNVKHPHPQTIRMTLATPASVAYANELLADPDSGWTEAATQAPTAAPQAVAPRPFDAVKSFADSVLKMLDERIKAADGNAHPFKDYFGDHPETIVAAKAQASELREVRTQVRILGDRALVDLMKFKPAPAPAAGDGLMLEPLIYAAIMHNGKPKTVAQFEQAADNVASMLRGRALVMADRAARSQSLEQERKDAARYPKLRAFVQGYSMDLWHAYERAVAAAPGGEDGKAPPQAPATQAWQEPGPNDSAAAIAAENILREDYGLAATQKD